jgi:pimeloyl-ACP methyl ester carboxylesterase
MHRFMLIHGSWHGGWCWQQLAPLLEADGCPVRCPDLPGHGGDPTPFEDISLSRYVDAVVAVLRDRDLRDQPSILVGHSFGGAVVTAVAVQCPAVVRRLVYLTAFFPRSGQSTTDLARTVQGSVLAGRITISADGLRQEVPQSVVREAFYGDCEAAVAAWAEARLRPDPYRPNIEPVTYDETALATVQKYYIECTRDRAIPLQLQRRMQQGVEWVGVEQLPSDHSPMLSHPAELAAILLRMARSSA